MKIMSDESQSGKEAEIYSFEYYFKYLLVKLLNYIPF